MPYRIGYLSSTTKKGELSYMKPVVLLLRDLEKQGLIELGIHYRDWTAQGVLAPGPDIEQVRANRFHGLVTAALDNDAYLQSLQSLKVPVVVLDHLPLGTRFDAVTFDNRGGGLLLARALLERGHKDFLFISQFHPDLDCTQGAEPMVENTVSTERRSGMQDALLGRNDVDEWPMLPSCTAPHALRHLRRDLVADFKRLMDDFGRAPDAILAHDVWLVDGIRPQLESAGLRLPDGTSIASFLASHPDAPYHGPTSHVAFSSEEMARAGWALLHERLTGKVPLNAKQRHAKVPGRYRELGSVFDRRPRPA